MIKMQDIIDSMNAKLGKENSAMIADDISQMLSFESESNKAIQNKCTERHCADERQETQNIL